MGQGGGKGAWVKKERQTAIPARATKRKRIKDNKPQTCRLGEFWRIFQTRIVTQNTKNSSSDQNHRRCFIVDDQPF